MQCQLKTIFSSVVRWIFFARRFLIMLTSIRFAKIQKVGDYMAHTVENATATILPPTSIDIAANLVLIQYIDNHFDLVLRMNVRSDAGDANIIDVAKAHIQILGDVVILPTGDEAKFILSVVDSDSIGVEGVVGLTDQIQFGPNL